MEADAQDAVPDLIRRTVLGKDAQTVPHSLDEVLGIEVFGIARAQGGAKLDKTVDGHSLHAVDHGKDVDLLIPGLASLGHDDGLCIGGKNPIDGSGVALGVTGGLDRYLVGSPVDFRKGGGWDIDL